MARKNPTPGAERPLADRTDPTAASPPPSPPPGSRAAPLVAVTMVNLAGVYFEPGNELPAEQVATAGESAIAALLEAGAIRHA